MGWLKRVQVRREVVKELRWHHYVLYKNRCSIEMQLIQIESRSGFASRQYRMKYMELVDICEELGRLEKELNRFGWWFIITGQK